MKIATLISFMLLLSVSLFAQEPIEDAGRRQAVHDQLTAASPVQLTETLEEKRARLVEALSDADLESARIMQQETLEVMDQAIALGAQKNASKESDRMKSIRETLAGLELDAPAKETAHEADQLVREFLSLLNQTTR